MLGKRAPLLAVSPPVEQPITTALGARAALKKAAWPTAKGRWPMGLTNIANIIVVGVLNDPRIENAVPIAIASRYFFMGGCVAFFQVLGTLIGQRYGSLSQSQKEIDEADGRDTTVAEANITKQWSQIYAMMRAVHSLVGLMTAGILSAFFMEKPIFLALGFDRKTVEGVQDYNIGISSAVLPGLMIISFMPYFAATKNVKKAGNIQFLQNLLSAAMVPVLALAAGWGMIGVGAGGVLMAWVAAFRLWHRYRQARARHYEGRDIKFETSIYSGIGLLLKQGWPFAMETIVDWLRFFAISLFLEGRDKVTLNAFYSSIAIMPIFINLVLGFVFGDRALLATKIGAAKQLMATPLGENELVVRQESYATQIKEIRWLVRESRRISFIVPLVSFAVIASLCEPIHLAILGRSSWRHNSDFDV